MIIDGLRVGTIWFDLDNTLIDRDGAMRRYLKSAWPDTQTTQRTWLDIDNHGYAPRELVCHAIAMAHNTTTQDVWSHMRQHIGAYVQPHPGLNERLVQLREHVSIGIISNGSGVNQRHKLKRAGLMSCFEDHMVFISGEFGVAKPQAKLFEYAMAQTADVAHHMLMIGDNPEHDCCAPHQLGMQTAWIAHDRVFPLREHPPTWTLANIEGLTQWLAHHSREENV